MDLARTAGEPHDPLGQVEDGHNGACVPDVEGLTDRLGPLEAREVLGFEAKVDLDEGLARTIAWYRERSPALT